MCGLAVQAGDFQPRRPISNKGLQMQTAFGGATAPLSKMGVWPEAAPVPQLRHEGIVVGHRDDGVAVVGRLDVDAVERVGRPRPERPGAPDAPHVGVGYHRTRPSVHDDEAVAVELEAVAADGKGGQGHEGRDGHQREPAPWERGT